MLTEKGGFSMKVRVEYAPVLENEVVLRCPRLDQELSLIHI